MNGARLAILAVALTVPAAAWGQADGEGVPEDARQQIEQLSGCFEVKYRFAEDGEHDIFSPEYGLEEPILEWIGLETPAPGRYLLTHASVVENRVVPHFHEIWTWLPEGEQWRHEVRSHTPDHPRSELRYDCTASWQQNLWSCHAGRADKPFRDRGAPFGFDRTDYDYLDRENRVLSTPRGWVHSQKNRKMRESGEVFAYELGWVTYRRVEDNRCAPGQEWMQQQGRE